ncbi:helix-turn-helix domain-containing protein [Trinickia violacea]|uniref:helix-turn-helix domain-containing protein n=1 Tax=Trinickia violacea TaxID=2571746 RepID=UPI0020C7DFB3|nr:helix-turn-helix domain-containing protein [Trinickia violacea]
MPPVLPEARSARRIGVVLFNGFALPGAVAITEVFHSANAFTDSADSDGARYEVCLLSAAGGRIASSSSVFVWTESVDTQRDTDDFRALFIVGGTGAANASRDDRLVAWLRRSHSRTDLLFPVAEGRLLLEAAGFGQTANGGGSGVRAAESERNVTHAAPAAEPMDPMRIAMSVVQEDLGSEAARHIADRIAPSAETKLTSNVRKNASDCVNEKIQESARWLEANGDRPIAIDDAAQIAAMSERNFLRRFKMEMGVTPSDYLTSVRLDMSCRLLVETDLPIDKIARRCGIGSGGRLSKLFRQHFETTPTQYRASKQVVGKST